MAHLLECVSPKIPMRSAILGAFSLFLQFLGYFSLSAYMYGHSRLYDSILFVSIAFFIVLGTAHHVKYALTEYVFLKLGRDTKAHGLCLIFLTVHRHKELLSCLSPFCYYADCGYRYRYRSVSTLGCYFHHITNIYPAVSISDHRYSTYCCDGFHACLASSDIEIRR